MLPGIGAKLRVARRHRGIDFVLQDQLLLWVGFGVFVVAMLVLDLRVFHRKAHEVRLREAIGWSIFWVTLAMIFNLGVWHYWPQTPGGYTRGQAALAFLTGYLIEKSLSVDNIFVFLMIFTYFQVPAIYQHRVLFWGILGALILRGVFIAAGVTLIHMFHWVVYIFGVFLIVTGVKMVWAKDKKIEPEKNPVLKLFRRFASVTPGYDGQRFFTRQGGRLLATPLFVTLLIVETTDVVFAVDSIPAVLGITRDPFIVYTSNIFAILGLRALYFALAGVMRLFHHLHYGLSFILAFVGTKMLLAEVYKISTGTSLGVIGATLVLSIIASLLWPSPRRSTDL